MAALFSEAWMKAFASCWNDDSDLRGALERVGFTSAIGYGITGESKPRAVMIVKNGEVVEVKMYDGQPLNWELRASETTWKGWLSKPPGMLGIGAAYTSGKLKFLAGDYASMIKDPRMAGPFVRSFQLMGRGK
jgi:hypothetical protein